MISPSELLRHVDAAFERLGAATPGWDDPNPERTPSDDAYSRVTDPAKWRILGARADAWLEALSTLGLATIERNASIDWSEPPSTVVTRADCALPVVAGGLPLVLARSRIESVDDAGVTIGVGSPAVVHRWIPDCGCDACDSGSQDALDELDEQVLAVVTGRFRRLRREDRTITVVSGQICQSAGLSGLTDPTTVLADPTGWEELDGPSWLETSERDANSPF